MTDECVSAPQTVAEQRQLIVTLNDQIKKFNQILTIVKHPLNGEEYVVFGLTLANEACKFQPTYTELETTLFHDILGVLIENREDYSMNWNDIYTIPSQRESQHISKQRIQELQEIWTEQGYLLQQDEKIYLGPRALVEYSNYFRAKYPELVAECPLCRNLVFWVNAMKSVSTLT